ncbi:MAG: antifreeze protein [Gemmobacter sp.]|nr:antifreeze protein [Gemmobacter sp.]
MYTTNVTESMRLMVQWNLMALEAQSVITMRLMGMAGMWNVSASEDARMFREKTVVAEKSARAAFQKAAQGGSPLQVSLAALKPVRARTRSNARRLTDAGITTP